MPKKQNLVPADVVRPYGEDLPEIITRQCKFYYIQHDNIRLRVMLGHSMAEDPRGSIIFCPGRTEFIEKYFESIEDLLNRGFHVLMIDPRGQGLSDRLLPDRLKSYVQDFQDYADDLGFAVETFDYQLPTPHIVMGHSMGGCVALLSIISGVLNPSAVICSAPMLGLFDVETSLTATIVKFCSFMGLGKRNLPMQKQEGGIPVPFEGNKLTSDPERFKRWASYFQTTPELRVAGPTIAWVAKGIKAMSYVNRNAHQLKIPGLVVAAGGDPIVDPSSIANFAGAAKIDYTVVPGALHELFMEKDEYRDQFFDIFDRFLEAQGL